MIARLKGSTGTTVEGASAERVALAAELAREHSNYPAHETIRQSAELNGRQLCRYIIAQ